MGCLCLTVFCLYAGGSRASNSEKIPLRILVHPAYSPAGTDTGRVAYLKAAIDEWQKKHPEVDLQLEQLSTNNNEAMAKLLEQANGGRAADAAMIDSFVFTNFMPYLQPVDALLEKQGIKKDDFFPFCQNMVSGKDGSFYGVQFTTDVRVLYYRKDVVPTPPRTWNDVLNLGKELKSKGFEPLLIPAGRGEGAAGTSIYPVFWGQGGELVDESGKAVFGTGANRDKMIAVFTYIKQLVDNGYLPQRAATYAAESDLNAEAATGKIAMFLGGNWQVNQLQSIIGETELEKWEVAPIPYAPGAKAMSNSGGWVWSLFTKDPQKQELAFDLLATVYFNNTGMAKWTSVAGYLPTRKTVYDNPDYRSNRFTRAFRTILETGSKMRPVADIYPKISLELQIALSSVVSGAKTPEQAVNDAWLAVTQR